MCVRACVRRDVPRQNRSVRPMMFRGRIDLSVRRRSATEPALKFEVLSVGFQHLDRQRDMVFFFFFFFSFALNCRQCCSENFRIWFLGHGFSDLGSQLWGLGNFRIWFSRHGFRDLGSQLWGLNFHTRGFQDRNLKTFRTWFSGCGISILGPGFNTGASQWPSATGTH
jgi:hypothetical protein